MKEIFDHQDIQHRIWINWYHTGGLVAKYADNGLTKMRGLSYQQFLVLIVMKKLGENANATEMAKLLDKNTNTLSTILDRMEEKGLVKKIRDTQDRRLVWAVMTPKGKEKLAVTTKGSLVLFEKLTACFNKEELEKFDVLLDKLMKNTDKLVNPKKPAKKRKLYKD
jgi:DNA-binding MarR family transcriptional regulator